MSNNNPTGNQKPLPWWKRWTSARANWWLKLVFWLLVIGGVIFVLIPGASGLFDQLSGNQVKT